MARVQFLATAAVAVLCAALSACGGGTAASAPVPAIGTLGGACFGNYTCLGDLVCAEICWPKGHDVVSGQDGGADTAVAPTGPCLDPQTVAILVDDAGTPKLVCAPDYPVWGIGPVSPTGFTDNGNGTVAHVLTGLTWQQTYSSGGWVGAKQYCDALTLAGSSAWRLPTRTELLSLVDFAQEDPAIDSKIFPETPSDSFWSASRLSSGGYHWFVSFDSGEASFYPESAIRRVRCVR